MTHTLELDVTGAIASLRDQGAGLFDPVRLHFLEALAQRTREHEGAVKRLLENKLREALAAYQTRFAQHPVPTSHWQTRQKGTVPQPSSLAALTRTLSQPLPNQAQPQAQASDASLGARPELKSLRYFRQTWSKLSVDKQLTQALAQGPENAGPLNSHRLVLRSLAVMQAISPDYLNRFMSYADTLLWLDQADSKPSVKTRRSAPALSTSFKQLI